MSFTVYFPDPVIFMFHTVPQSLLCCSLPILQANVSQGLPSASRLDQQAMSFFEVHHLQPSLNDPSLAAKTWRKQSIRREKARYDTLSADERAEIDLRVRLLAVGVRCLASGI